MKRKNLFTLITILTAMSISGCNFNEDKDNYSITSTAGATFLLNSNTGAVKVLRDGRFHTIKVNESVNKRFEDRSTLIADSQLKITAKAKVVNGKVYAKYELSEVISPDEKNRDIDWVRDQVSSGNYIAIHFEDDDGYVLHTVKIPIKDSTRLHGYDGSVSLTNVVIESYEPSHVNEFTQMSIGWNFTLHVPPREKKESVKTPNL